MMKKILCLAMTMMMVVGAPMTVNAEEKSGGDGWVVDFDGENLNSNFKDSIDDNVSNVHPGDTVSFKIQIKNSSSVETDWYMTNEVLETLGAGRVSGGAYEYVLTYTDSANAESTLYDSKTVGGDVTEGLKQATTGGLENYFYVGRLAKDKSGTVNLKVTIEGVTNDTSYQNTLAKLEMTFAVEKVATGTTTTRNNVITNAVRTGDTSRVLLFSIIALVSGVVLLGFGLYKLKQHKKGE